MPATTIDQAARTERRNALKIRTRDEHLAKIRGQMLHLAVEIDRLRVLTSGSVANACWGDVSDLGRIRMALGDILGEQQE